MPWLLRKMENSGIKMLRTCLYKMAFSCIINKIGLTTKKGLIIDEIVL